MSSPRRTVILSPDFQADFIDIRLYTLQQWGEDQRDRYETALLRAIAALADFPEVGARLPRLFPGCRVRPVERHIIYHRILADAVKVVRILHERTDPIHHFQP